MEPINHSPPQPPGPAWLAGAGALGAAAVWVILGRWFPFFASQVEAIGLGMRPSDEHLAAITQAAFHNGLAAFGLLGGVLGFAFAVTTAIRHRSARVAAIGIPSGLLLGAAGGMLGGWCATMVSQALAETALVPRKYRVFNPALARACGWGLIGLGAGLGFSLPLANRRAIAQATIGAFLGGLLAAPCYQVLIGLAGMLAQLAGTEELIPEDGVVRAVWLGTVGVFIGLAAGLAGRTTKRQTAVASGEQKQPAVGSKQ